jgi:hypothetical protein
MGYEDNHKREQKPIWKEEVVGDNGIARTFFWIEGKGMRYFRIAGNPGKSRPGKGNFAPVLN